MKLLEKEIKKYSVIYYENENSINPVCAAVFDTKKESDDLLEREQNDNPNRIYEIRFERL